MLPSSPHFGGMYVPLDTEDPSEIMTPGRTSISNNSRRVIALDPGSDNLVREVTLKSSLSTIQRAVKIRMKYGSSGQKSKKKFIVSLQTSNKIQTLIFMMKFNSLLIFNTGNNFLYHKYTFTINKNEKAR